MLDGFIFINKEAGITSRKVCNQVSFLFNEKKVGHIGTLDPFAEGLLIICLNKATKAGAFIDESIKTYRATLKLGVETDSLDLTGKIISTKKVEKLYEEKITSVLNSFVGEINQTVPITSAVHVNGKRLYEYARNGEQVQLPVRKQIIYDIKLISFSNDLIEFEVSVNKGTYIRSLGLEIAKKLNTVGHLLKLTRTRIGPFYLDNSVKLNDVSKQNIVPIIDVLSKCCGTFLVDDEMVNDIKNGKIHKLKLENDENNVLIINKDNYPIAMYSKYKDNTYVFQRGLFWWKSSILNVMI